MHGAPVEKMRSVKKGLSFIGAFSVMAFAACSTPADEKAGGTEDPFSEDSENWEPISKLLGNPPNFAQLGNGSTMSVVSRAWGRGAKAGALVELFYPHYNADNLWDSYVGVKTKGASLRWAHQLTLKGQRIVKDTGLVVSDFEAPGMTLSIEDVVRPKNNAHLRHVTIRNTGSAPLQEVDLAFYAFYTINNLPGGDEIHYDAMNGAFLQHGDSTSIATLADRLPNVAHCGHANRDWGRELDARLAAEQNKLSPCVDGADTWVTGVNGTMLHRLDAAIPPGQSRDITYAIGLGPNNEKALEEAKSALGAGGFAARADEDRSHWASVLGRATLPARLPADAAEVYRRAIITIMQHRVDNGAFIAAPTLTSPVYKLVWPRDGSKTAVDMLEAGFAPEAKGWFELLEKLVKDDGSFSVNYKPDASGHFFDFGRSGNENDQPGMLPWGVHRVYEATHDEGWTKERWPTIRRVAEHLLSISADGSALVAASRDLWELETGGSWTYANASAIAGLEAAAKIGRLVGGSSASADAERYDARAGKIRNALNQRLVTSQGYFARGFKDGRVDERLEIGNLALGVGGFNLLPDTDSRMAKLGDLIAQRLGTPGGAIRRYEGDRYYGGQPWPVASVWLSLHRLARGDRAGAEALFRVMTEEAKATDTLMLGEQFDESKKAWLSAIPLVWSEAAYIRNARALYGD
jgi:GH15 family glucan-1,4-alpha-glucosidase